MTILSKKSETKIVALVCDGKRGLLKPRHEFVVQMCHSHQTSIVTRYITRKPRMQASIELKSIIHLLCKTDKESFEGMLNEWFYKWESFMNERYIDPVNGKSRYVHIRLRRRIIY